MQKIYYDDDTHLSLLHNTTIGIIGYGIQGRAQALNLRDSGLTVLIANRNDRYHPQAIKDGFDVVSIDDIASRAQIIFLLIPDQAHKYVYETHLKGQMSPKSLLIFAHGYTLRFEDISFQHTIDIAMIAPRMPGGPIRKNYLKKHGIPAFIDVYQDTTKTCLKRILALCQALGFTRAGVLPVSYKVEAELDLFVEQFVIPTLIKSIHQSFETLVKKYDFPAIPTLLELYASGELGEVLTLAAQQGIGRAFEQNASPTCQFGIASSFEDALNVKSDELLTRVIHRIQNGNFSKALDHEGRNNYKEVKSLWEKINSEQIITTQEWINNHIKHAESSS